MLGCWSRSSDPSPRGAPPACAATDDRDVAIRIGRHGRAEEADHSSVARLPRRVPVSRCRNTGFRRAWRAGLRESRSAASPIRRVMKRARAATLVSGSPRPRHRATGSCAARYTSQAATISVIIPNPGRAPHRQKIAGEAVVMSYLISAATITPPPPRNLMWARLSRARRSSMYVQIRRPPIRELASVRILCSAQSQISCTDRFGP